MEKLSGPTKARLQGEIDKKKVPYGQLHSPRRNRCSDQDDEYNEEETPFQTGIGPNPRAIRVLRNACTVSFNLIGKQNTVLERRAHECVADFVIALCEAEKTREEFKNYLLKNIHPIRDRMRRGYKRR